MEKQHTCEEMMRNLIIIIATGNDTEAQQALEDLINIGHMLDHIGIKAINIHKQENLN